MARRILGHWGTWAMLALLATAAVVASQFLPLAEWLEAATDWIRSFGAWGPLVYALVYVVAGLLLFPGSILTFTAGALFGLGWGVVISSLAATTIAGIACLIARYLARERVAAIAARYPFFAALDQAIAEGGWRIVALVRLSPLFPFNLQNYLYGVTAIRFIPYLVTTWIAMLPGTFLAAYLGSLGREGIEATAGEGASAAEWALRLAGLAATVAGVVYLTHLAKKKLAEAGATEAG